jgi:predicted hotdog family 3-hydroxylacyl-ACP dehydratase
MNPDHARIRELVPHAGAMCLLGAVTQWDATHITCTGMHRDEPHPLARDGVVPAIVACEYAAQAAAVHGALLDGADAPRPGMLAKIMEMDLSTSHFPHGSGAVEVRAHLASRLGSGCLYEFAVGEGAQAIASGRLIVAFSSPEPA